MEQTAAYEKELGVTLPDQYREFISQISDGLRVGQNYKFYMPAMFHENAIESPIWNSRLKTILVAFPFREYMHNDEGLFLVYDWSDLSEKDKMTSEIGLHIGGNETSSAAVLVLTGAERGNIWCHSLYGGLRQPCSVPFLETLEIMLDHVR